MKVLAMELHGQIGLGERYADQEVVMAEVESGLVQVGQFVPDDELRFQEPEVLASINRGLRWITENSPAKTDLGALERRLGE